MDVDGRAVRRVAELRCRVRSKKKGRVRGCRRNEGTGRSAGRHAGTQGAPVVFVFAAAEET